MTGQQIYVKYQTFRDFSGSEADEYAQLLDTLSQVGQEFYPLLEKAEAQNKRLDLADDMVDEVTIANIIFV